MFMAINSGRYFYFFLYPLFLLLLVSQQTNFLKKSTCGEKQTQARQKNADKEEI